MPAPDAETPSLLRAVLSESEATLVEATAIDLIGKANLTHAVLSSSEAIEAGSADLPPLVRAYFDGGSQAMLQV